MVLCLICGASVNSNETRALPANRQCLGILLSSLMIFDHADVNEMRDVYALGGKRNKQLCKGHHAKAAYFLLDEVERSGGLSRYRDPKAGGRNTYVNEGNIPQQILDLLNATVKQLDIENVLTPRNLATFLNDALVRYFRGSEWHNSIAGSNKSSGFFVMPSSSDSSKRVESRKRPAEAIDVIPVPPPQPVRPCGSTHLEGGYSSASGECVQPQNNSGTGGENVSCSPTTESDNLFEQKIKVEPGLEEEEPSNFLMTVGHIKPEPLSH
ncbi:hypothetical protein ANCCAN_01375 [Ancylostoma caninum]|uniref:Uncharacterized protein n=1 Tax=Ancylostoma caninum TaxID=29170 RepID=A0A368H6T6_ANCCA|nr:hypothetical protein ANCCAN_01375 [Ancylostoma caninum]